MTFASLLNRLRETLTKNQFIFISGIVVGLLSATGAIVLKTLVFNIHYIVTFTTTLSYQQVLFLGLPFVGILLTMLFIRYVLKDNFQRGSSMVLKRIAKHASFIDKAYMYSHVITSSLTVGFGGSAGLEAPIVVTGAAIGSNFGRITQLSYRERTLMLGCGAAAGIAAVFNAPIAGVMFALEVLIYDVSISSFIPLITSAAVGALLSKIVFQEGILFYFVLKQPFNYANLPFYFLLAVVTGILSVHYIRMFLAVEKKFSGLKVNRVVKALIGGLLLGILIFLFPPLFGEGYSSIKLLASGNIEKLFQAAPYAAYIKNDWVLIGAVGLIALLKTAAASITINSGGNGGNFAPTLFVGAFAGFGLSRFMNTSFGLTLPESNFTIIGMAGILGGVMHSPLTAIFLIAEITGGYELMIPLMLVVVVSLVIVKQFEPYSLDKKEMAKRGEILTANKDKDILSLIDKQDIIEKDYTPINYKSSLKELQNVISSSRRNLFPILDDNGNLMGIVSMDEIRHFIFEMHQLTDLMVVEVMSQPSDIVQLDEELESVMAKFERTNSWNLPVLDGKKYLGFISKSGTLSQYRQQVKTNYTDEN